MKNYEYIIFDWDGNLAKTLELWLNAFRAVFKKRGFNLTNEEISGAFGQITPFAKNLGIVDFDKVVEEGLALGDKNIPSVELYPDALDVLDDLKSKNKHLAVLTTSPRVNLMRPLEKYKMVKYFEVIIVSEDLTHHKPDPEGVEKALEKLKGNKDQTIIIGDSDKDLGAATNAGIDSILFYPPDHKKYYDLEKLKTFKPTYIVTDFKEIKNIIK